MFNHHNYLSWLWPKKELTQVYFSTGLRYFALSLIGIFVPLYLYKELAFTLQQTLSMYIFYPFIFALMTPVAAKYCSRYGAKHAVIFSMPFYLLFMLLLYLLPVYRINLLILGFIAGGSLAFYWMGMNLIFYSASHQKHRGEEVGKRNSISIFAATLGPLLGGLSIKFIGFKSLFILAGILLLLSGFLLFFSKERIIKYDFSLRSVINKERWKDSLFFVSRGSRDMADGLIWPMFIFFILNDYLSLGIVGSVLVGISGVLVFFSGKYSDRTDRRKLINYSTFFESLSWFARAAVDTVMGVFGVTAFGSITNGVQDPMVTALTFDKAKKEDPAGYFVSREVFISLGKMGVVALVLILNDFTSGMIFQGLINLAAFLF